MKSATERPQGRLLDTFFASLKKAGQSALLLDYDGTLAPFRVRPETAVPYRGVRTALNRILAAQRTRVIVISGRWTKDLIPLLKLRPLPEIWGSHGWERLKPDGAYQMFPFDARALRGLAEADRWAAAEGMEERSEHKPGCLAVHWRGSGTEAVEAVKSKILRAWAPLAERAGLKLMEFDGGLELRVPGRNKGLAVRTVLEELGRGAAVAYLGDDLTDEDAFRTVKGKGLGVLVRKEYRPSAAQIWLRPPGELLEFLARWYRSRGEMR